MRLAAHEAHALNELTLSCVNSITNMGYMISHAEDPEFKSILEKHLPLHIRDYNMKVEFLKKMEGATKELPLLKEEGILPQFTNMVSPQAPAVQPRTIVDNMNDREMATAYLLTLKRAGREYAWNAMEMANPEIRSFCQTAFMMSCSHAYEMWQYMVKNGYYLLEEANQNMVQQMGSMYTVVPENPAQMGLMDNQNPTAGNSNQLYQ